MTEYRDFWDAFRSIQEATRKKLLKRPNYEDAISQMRQLAVDMDEAEMPEHVAACQRMISLYYEKLQNFPLELHHLLKAAEKYAAARMLRHSLHISVMHESEALMEECYLRAIEKCVKQGLVKVAAATAVETAEHFLKFHNIDRAYHYFLKASRFAQSDIYLTINILKKMCGIAEKLSSDVSDELLADVQVIWSNLLKDMCFTGVIREALVRVEFYVLLLNLQQAKCTDDWQRPFLVQYSDVSAWQNGKLSVMTRDEYNKASKFVKSLRTGDHTQASRLLSFHLSKLLEDDSREFAAAIVASIDNDPVVDRGFDEILRSSDSNELEKRQKLFDLYNGLVRRNQIKLESL